MELVAISRAAPYPPCNRGLPEDQLFSFSVGSMRPFGHLAIEMVSMAAAGIRGLATGQWTMVSDLLHHSGASALGTREQLLEAWDGRTKHIDALWPQIRCAGVNVRRQCSPGLFKRPSGQCRALPIRAR